jgi:CTP synthase (UTP-ammonia lyase)
MPAELKIGIIGDFDPASHTHPRTNDALQHAAAQLGRDISIAWIPTEELSARTAAVQLDGFAGIWCSPGSPYRSMEGALAGIRFARERGYPFTGT